METEPAEAQALEPAVTHRHITWDEVRDRLVRYDNPGTKVYGVPRNGMVIASLLQHAKVVVDPAEADLILDDLIDSGATRRRYSEKYQSPFAALFDKQNGDGGAWLVFPWENETGPEDAVLRLLTYVGEDPTREGLVDTPSRYVRALAELTSGYKQDPQVILDKVFTEPYDEMVVVGPVPFTSLCEHHVLPFSGVAHVAYIPNGKVVGLSKLPRLVQCYARRLQIQERMTQQIVAAITHSLEPLGAACVIQAQHLCMKIRGVRSDGQMTTSCLTGMFRHNPDTRAEFLRFTRS